MLTAETPWLPWPFSLSHLTVVAVVRGLGLLAPVPLDLLAERVHQLVDERGLFERARQRVLDLLVQLRARHLSEVESDIITLLYI